MITPASAEGLPRHALRLATQRLEQVAGGPARARVVVLFASVLALENADATAVGAAGPQLEGTLHITNTQLGLLAAISTLVGAIATVPVGALTDRVRRVRLLAVAVALWGIAMAASATAQGYSWLLFCRLGLGAVSAAAGPTIASLTGDFFAAAERAKIYGYILSGELLGAGVGFVVSGSIAGALSWRWAFVVLAIPAGALAIVIWCKLPEPQRGGQSRLDVSGADGGGTAAQRTATARRIRPLRSHILTRDPAKMTLREAVWYVLRIRTNVWLIAASAVGFFFFAGMRTFGVVFVRGHFALSQPTATAILFLAGVGSLVGVLTAGRLADRLIRKGILTARVLVGAVGYFVAAAVLLPALLVPSLVVAVPLLMIAAAGLGAPNPPLDAARLDIVPSRLWGRAEGVRTLLRQTAQAGAPLLFGLMADEFGSSGGALGVHSAISSTSAHALQLTFLIMLIPLALNGVFLLGARKSYPPDVATALASERAVASLRGSEQ